MQNQTKYIDKKYVKSIALSRVGGLFPQSLTVISLAGRDAEDMAPYRPLLDKFIPVGEGGQGEQQLVPELTGDANVEVGLDP